MPEEDLRRILSLSRARLRVLEEVSQCPGYAAHVARRLKLSRSTALGHLKGLESHALVRAERAGPSGPWIVYRPTERGLQLLALLGRAERGP